MTNPEIPSPQPAPEHTPGPWIVVQEHYSTVIRGAEVEHEELGTKFTHRGYVGTTWGTRTPTTDADAWLMAAAPDLLAACENARDILRTDRQGFVDCHQVHGSRVDDAVAHGLVWVAEDVWIPPDVADALRDYDRAIELIDKATAKATGEQA